MLRVGQELVFAAAAALVLASCEQTPAFAPPPQVSGGNSARHIVMVADPDVGGLLVRDIGPLEGGRFRWTGQNPEVRLEVPATDGLKLRARFWVAADALKAVGPVSISYRVNGDELGRATYSAEGEQVFEKAVPANWLHVGENHVSLELNHVYERNGAKLGVALAELGFTD